MGIGRYFSYCFGKKLSWLRWNPKASPIRFLDTYQMNEATVYYLERTELFEWSNIFVVIASWSSFHFFWKFTTFHGFGDQEESIVQILSRIKLEPKISVGKENRSRYPVKHLLANWSRRGLLYFGMQQTHCWLSSLFALLVLHWIASKPCNTRLKVPWTLKTLDKIIDS